MIRGVLIPFEGEGQVMSLSELAKEVTDKIGYAAEVVSMDNKTYRAIQEKSA